jgi:purine-binding chemotaxis protein CheW
MNLADIRKKAGEAKKPEKGRPLAPAVETSSDEHDSEEVLPLEQPDEPDSKGTYDLAPYSEPAEQPLTADDFEAADLVELEELLSELPERKPLLPFVHAEPLAEALSGGDLPVRVSARSGFDPLAALLAGRESVAADETLSGALTPHASSEIEEYLCFRVAGEKYALNIMDIKEIIKPREVTEVPRMPGFISGVISLRGVIIPVMDMRLRLSLPVGEATVRERVVVLRTHAGFCGVLVDEVIQVVRIDRSAIEDPPAVLDGIDREFVKGLGRIDNRILILLNLESILDLGIH